MREKYLKYSRLFLFHFSFRLFFFFLLQKEENCKQSAHRKQKFQEIRWILRSNVTFWVLTQQMDTLPFRDDGRNQRNVKKWFPFVNSHCFVQWTRLILTRINPFDHLSVGTTVISNLSDECANLFKIEILYYELRSYLLYISFHCQYYFNFSFSLFLKNVQRINKKHIKRNRKCSVYFSFYIFSISFSALDCISFSLFFLCLYEINLIIIEICKQWKLVRWIMFYYVYELQKICIYRN